jgi:uncharacterized Ntn-hydrolase superfamily protein
MDSIASRCVNAGVRASLVTTLVLWPTIAGATFSIIARDPNTGELGVAIASRVFAVRLAGPLIDPEVGVIARQSDVILKHGPRAMELLKSGLAPQDAIAQLLKEDLAPTHQIALIDVNGRVAASTGTAAMEWKGHQVGENYSAQGNILVGPQVVEAMAAAFERTKGPLAERLFAALKAGDDAGGDKRGRQSAFLMVVRKGAAVYGEPMVNIAVDDSREPLKELRRLLDVQTAWNLRMDAAKAFAAGKFGEARAIGQKIIGLAPHDVAQLMGVGMNLYFDGDSAEAVQVLRKARQLDDQTFKVWWDILRSYPAAKKMVDDKEFERQVFR